MVLDVGGGAIDEDAIDGDRSSGLARRGSGGEASIDEGLLVGDGGIKGESGRDGTHEQRNPSGSSDEEEQEACAAWTRV